MLLDFWDAWPTFYIPQGYKIVEDKDHKTKRLTEKIEGLEKLIEFYSTKLAEAKKELKNVSK